jgi:hypothetical protein
MHEVNITAQHYVKNAIMNYVNKCQTKTYQKR